MLSLCHPWAVWTRLWPRPKKSVGLALASLVNGSSVSDPGTVQGMSPFTPTAVILASEVRLYRFGNVKLSFQSRYKIRNLGRNVLHNLIIHL